jgi:hypothetical protein
LRLPKDFGSVVPSGSYPWHFTARFWQAGRSKVSDDFPAHIAFVRAWGIYLMRNCAVSENDARRCTLERYLKKRCQAGENDPEELASAGLSYLRRLDVLCDN